MKSSVVVFAAGAAFAAALLAAAPGIAQDAMKTVQDRQAVMKQQGKDLEAIKAYLDGKGELPAAQAGGSDLVTAVGKIPTLFPAGTGMEQFPGKSGAKPAIWTDGAKFSDAQKAAADKAKALDAALKGGNKEAIQAAFGDMGKNGCGGCHQPFREKI